MVTLADSEASNGKIASTLPAELVAVFVGGTSGIGEYTLKQFAQDVRRPRVYFTGRNEQAGERITAECKRLNHEGQYMFLSADTSLLKNVDEVCREIKSKETTLNVLFISTGTFTFHTKTSEDLEMALSLVHYSRLRFAVNLLPLLQRATSLRRVVSVFSGTKEGKLFGDDLDAQNVSLMNGLGHRASLVTLGLEALATKAPEVSFIHAFPGAVKSNIARSGQGTMVAVMNLAFKVMLPLMGIPEVESGKRHVYLATSAQYPAAEGGADGVPMSATTSCNKGTDGVAGSGTYSIGEQGDSASPKIEHLLAGFRKEGLRDRVWEHTVGEFKRVTGVEAIQ